MQKYCTELTERLLKSLDKEYNVVDMGAVVDVITALERTTITKEVLEVTRLGKYINELRRKTSNDALAKRAKDLVRRWRDMVLPSAHTTPQPTPADPAPPALNGAKPQSPALRGLKPQSPALRGLKPQSPLLRDTTPLRVLSPALSVHSDRSRSPHTTPNKQTINATTNHRPSPTGQSPKLQNHLTEAVPRTHSSNKRLRKDDSENHSAPSTPTSDQPLAKRQRLNGENLNAGFNYQVPSPLCKDRVAEKALEPEPPLAKKKRGRKPGSKSVKKQPPVEDHVKEKLASISRNPKLKTTQELLADLRAKGSSVATHAPSHGSRKEPSALAPTSGSAAAGVEDAWRSNNEHVAKYLQSQSDVLRSAGDASLQSRLRTNDDEHNASKYRDAGGGDGITHLKRSNDRDSPSESSPKPRQLTVDEILAKLPPLDRSAIVWSDQGEDDDDCREASPRVVTTDELERLHTQRVEGLNGNFQPDDSTTRSIADSTADGEKTGDSGEEAVSNSTRSKKQQTATSTGSKGAEGGRWGSDKNVGQTDREFREWHEMLARPSYDGQILHILPYVIID